MTHAPVPGCPPPADLRAFHSGRLPAAADDDVAAHLDGCPACEAALQALDACEESVLAGLRRPAPPPAGAGAVVAGRYKLIEPLGEGGMGSVWMAQQTEPVRRAVAVKLIKLGMDTKAVLARFEAERQALALMDHPNIAKVLDAGQTDAGRPFFVMELVKGLPINRYCDEHRLTVRDRLALFVPVCQAVQHAHQKGVIHRDLKPTNVLVARYDDRPVPKVIDFGVAKAAGQPLTERTLMTGFGAVVGTPEYMSPEQAAFNALDVDTRTDVYALGVILYELLTGCTPVARAEVQAAGLLEALRLVRERESPRPSTRLSTAATLPYLAAARGTDPGRLAGLVRGELDWIVLTALEKDRTRRYQTANALAADLQRYLAGEPVQAVPPTAGYRVRKFARRYKGPVLAAGLVLLALVGGVVGTSVGLVRAWAARAEADRRRADAEAAERAAESERDAARVAESASRELGGLLYHIFRQADVRRQAEWRAVVDPDVPLREVVAWAGREADVRTDLTGRPGALVHWAIGDALLAAGDPTGAVHHHEKGVALSAAAPGFGPAHGETIFGLHKLVESLRAAGRPADALAVARRAIAVVAPNPPALIILNDIGWCHHDLGQMADAVRAFEVAAAQGTAEAAAHDGDLSYAVEAAVVDTNLADAYREAGRPAEAVRLANTLLTAPAVRADDLLTARVREVLGRTHAEAGDWPAAEAEFRRVLDTRRWREPKLWTTALTAARLGRALAAQGRYGEARPLQEEADRVLTAQRAVVPAHRKKWLTEAAGWLADLPAVAPPPRPAERVTPAG